MSLCLVVGRCKQFNSSEDATLILKNQPLAKRPNQAYIETTPIIKRIIMKIPDDTVHELSMLSLFNQSTYQEGIKVHAHEASAQDIAATKRLFAKGLISQDDGGYLTTLGKDAVEKLQDLLLILK